MCHVMTRVEPVLTSVTSGSPAGPGTGGVA